MELLEDDGVGEKLLFEEGESMGTVVELIGSEGDSGGGIGGEFEGRRGRNGISR